MGKFFCPTLNCQKWQVKVKIKVENFWQLKWTNGVSENVLSLTTLNFKMRWDDMWTS